MVANWITLARLPLLAGCLAILYLGSPLVRIAGVGLLLVGLLLDTVDGVVARARDEAGLLGSVLDIASDRLYELALWVTFSHLGLVPPIVPIVVLARTTLTDAIRSLGVGEGASPFDQARSRVARFLVGSPWMRSAYSAVKVGAFCGLALAQASLGFPPGCGLREAAPAILITANVLAWIAVGLCLLRGAPVMAEGVRRHWSRSEATVPPC